MVDSCGFRRLSFSIDLTSDRFLRTFALIVSAHPYCARNSLPRHALSARAVGEIYSAGGHFSIYARV